MNFSISMISKAFRKSSAAVFAAFIFIMPILSGCGTTPPSSPSQELTVSDGSGSSLPSPDSEEAPQKETESGAAISTTEPDTVTGENTDSTHKEQAEQSERVEQEEKEENTKNNQSNPNKPIENGGKATTATPSYPTVTRKTTAAVATSAAATTTRRTTTKATTVRTTAVRTTTAQRTTAPTTQAAAAPDDAAFRADFENEVVRLVNEERAKQGLSALSVSPELRETARLRSQEIVQTFSHTRPDGSSCFTAFPNWSGTKAENIAAGYATPAKVMEGWMNSDGHRRNILTPGLRYIGVGCYESGGRLYWTQAFFG